jgi:hypothetical protein
MSRFFTWFSPPPFTEEWARTYLQVLFESFLFAIGVPAAIYNLIEPDIKHLTQTRARARRYILETVLLYVATFVVLWLMPPDPSSQPGVVIPSSAIKSFVAMTSVTALPLGVLFVGLWLNQQFQREKVIKRLESELINTAESELRINMSVLNDLSYLGEHGRAGTEKQLVLDVFNRLTDTVEKEIKTFQLKYNGFELESLIRHIPWILDNPHQSGDDENYQRTVEVLATIWRWVESPTVTDDALSTREAIRHLALRSVERTSEGTSLAYLEIAADCDSHMVFDIGLAAIKAQKYTLAAAALTKLEAMLNRAIGGERAVEISQETMSNLLGMAASLAADGASGVIRAETTLRLNAELFSPSLGKALNDATTYHYDSGRFEIADKIRNLVEQASTMRSIDLDEIIAPTVPSAP